MVEFSRPPSNSIFSRRLPGEISTIIFDLATTNCSYNAANCRLVSQEFYHHSSPYLVRTIVIAARLDALRKARDVLSHPYFSKKVTHLLWDASFYEEALATDTHEYESNYNIAFDHFLKDPAYCQNREDDSALEAQLRYVGPMQTNESTRLRGSRSLLESNDPADDVLEHNRSMMRDWQAAQRHPDWLLNDNRAIGAVPYKITDPMDIIEVSLMRGWHLTFPEYFRRWRNQESIYSARREMNGSGTERMYTGQNLARHYFLKALAELPLLKHVSYGDWRGLAFEDETIDQLGRRLFGFTLPPSLADMCDLQESVFRFLDGLTESGRTWLSVSIGRHPFERCFMDGTGTLDTLDRATSSVMTMGSEELCNGGLNARLDKLLVQSLRLPLIFNQELSTGYPTQVNAPLGSGIVNLDIGSRTFADLFTRSVSELMNPSLDNLLSPLLPLTATKLDTLQSLTLRGFMFNIPTMREVLSKCASTLRTFRLLDCCCPESYDSVERYARDEIASALTLTGVEIYGLLFNDLIFQDWEPHCNDADSKYRAMRHHEDIWDYETQKMVPNTRVWDLEALKTRSHQAQEDLVSSWPYSRPELEADMLGGRTNTIVRRERNLTVVSGDVWSDRSIAYQ